MDTAWVPTDPRAGGAPISFGDLLTDVGRVRAVGLPPPVPGLTVSATLRPHPVQPVVARSGLDARLRDGVRAALLTAHRVPEIAPVLHHAGFARCRPIDDQDHQALRGQQEMTKVPTRR